MPKRLPDAKRAAILADIKAGKQRNQAARDHKVSPSTVSSIARDAGLVSAFDRTLTEKASRAKAADNKARREVIKGELLDDVERFRERAWSEYKLAMSTPAGVEIVTLPLPPLQDQRAAYTGIGIALDKNLAIERHDSSDDGADHAKSMLGRLFTGLAEAVAGDEPQTPQDDG